MHYRVRISYKPKYRSNSEAIKNSVLDMVDLKPLIHTEEEIQIFEGLHLPLIANCSHHRNFNWLCAYMQLLPTGTYCSLPGVISGKKNMSYAFKGEVILKTLV